MYGMKPVTQVHTSRMDAKRQKDREAAKNLREHLDIGQMRKHIYSRKNPNISKKESEKSNK